jgi:hypothetical protein
MSDYFDDVESLEVWCAGEEWCPSDGDSHANR